MLEAQAERRAHLVTLLCLVPFASLFGEVLLRFTHHRPLGAATWLVSVALGYGALSLFIERISGPRWLGMLGGLASVLVVLRAIFVA